MKFPNGLEAVMALVYGAVSRAREFICQCFLHNNGVCSIVGLFACFGQSDGKVGIPRIPTWRVSVSVPCGDEGVVWRPALGYVVSWAQSTPHPAASAIFIQWSLISMISGGGGGGGGPSNHISRNFTLTVASCISVIMPGDFKVVCIKQVFNSVCINQIPL